MVGTPYYPYQLSNPPAGVTLSQEDNGFEITTTMRSAMGWALCIIALLVCTIAFMPGADLTPVLLLALSIGLIGARSIFGRIIIGARGDAGWLIHQWGPVRRAKQFSWGDIQGIGGAPVGVLETPADYEPPPGLRYYLNGKQDAIILQKASDRIIFGSSLSGRRKWYVAKALTDLEIARRQTPMVKAS